VGYAIWANAFFDAPRAGYVSGRLFSCTASSGIEEGLLAWLVFLREGHCFLLQPLSMKSSSLQLIHLIIM